MCVCVCVCMCVCWWEKLQYDNVLFNLDRAAVGVCVLSTINKILIWNLCINNHFEL